MAHDSTVIMRESHGPLIPPWACSAVGLAAVSTVFAAQAYWDRLWPIHLALMVLGLLAGSVGVMIRPRSPAILGLATLTALVAFGAVPEDWYSARMALRALAGVAAVATWLYHGDAFQSFLDEWEETRPWIARGGLAAILVALILAGRYVLGFSDSETQFWVMVTVAALALELLLLAYPQVLRKVLVSGLILFHFGGILTAVCSVPPSPWLVNQVWLMVYRPYLQFMYLNNAYHFYSPDPGPPTLLWFYIEYDDGSTRWVKIPNRQEHAKDALGQEFYRRLSITESTNQVVTGSPPVPDAVLDRRKYAALELGIDFHDTLDLSGQYRPPFAQSRRLINYYAEYAAHAFANEPTKIEGVPPEFLGVLGVSSDGGLASALPWAALALADTHRTVEIKRFKIYRVVHRILQPQELARGDDPCDPSTFYPYYQGTFDKDGKSFNPYGSSIFYTAQGDPLLYWLIPIVKREKPDLGSPIRALPAPNSTKKREFEIINYLDKHAAS